MNRDAFPPLSELPAMLAAYALLPALGWAILRNDDYRALVFNVVTRAAFWQIVSVGLVVYLIAAVYLFYREWKEPLT